MNDPSNDYKDFQRGYNRLMNMHYKVFELNVDSELAFPELLPIAHDQEQTDVTIRFGSVSMAGIKDPIKSTPSFQAKKDQLWLNIPGVARYLVSNGCEIVIDCVDKTDETSIRIFLLGSCFGALLLQRGFFVLHGNAVRIGSYAFSIAGHSGAGKSTLAGSLAKRGYSVLADDVCAINAKGEILPSFPQIKLWADAAKQLSIETGSLRKIRPDMDKFAVPLQTSFCSKPFPLKLIYILNTHNDDSIKIKNLTGFEKYLPLRTQAYRLHYVEALDLQQNHKAQCLRLAGGIELAQLTRPAGTEQLEQLTDYIESDLNQRGLLSPLLGDNKIGSYANEQ